MSGTASSSGISATSRGGRSLVQTGKATFNQIKLQAGAQRSHIIPQEVYKSFSDAFKKISDEAKFPEGSARFDPDNWFDNGQALPSKNAGSGGTAIYDLAQHNGSHPEINSLAKNRLAVIFQEMTTRLDRVNDPEVRNAILLKANEKVVNLADALAAISVGGVVDPAKPELRAVYNLADPNGKNLWNDWDTLSDATKKTRIRENLDSLLSKLLDSAGNPTEQGQKTLKVLRDLTLNHVGGLSPADAQIAHKAIEYMAARGIDLNAVDVLALVRDHKAEIVSETGELAERVERLSAARAAAKLAGKVVGKVVAGAFAALDIYDHVDTAGRIVAAARGDAKLISASNSDGQFSGVDYLKDLVTGSQQEALVTSLPVTDAVKGITGRDALFSAVQTYLNDRNKFPLPADLRLVLIKVDVDSQGKWSGGQFVVDDTTTPAIDNIAVVVRAGSTGGAGSMLLLRRSTDGKVLTIQDTATNKAYSLFDPAKSIELNVRRLGSDKPAERTAGAAALNAATERGVEVKTNPGGGLDTNSAEQVSQFLHDHEIDNSIAAGTVDVGDDQIIEVRGSSSKPSTVVVAIDGVIHVIRGLTCEIKEFLTSVAKATPDIVKLDGGQVGLALGSVLGKRLTSDPFGQIVASGTLATVLGAVGEFIQENVLKLRQQSSTNLLGKGSQAFEQAAWENIKGAGVGALSSYLTAELVGALGLKGTVGEVANSLGSAAINTIANNILNPNYTVVENGKTVTKTKSPFANVKTAVAAAAASYLGGKLASAISTPESVGGQIGAQVGAAYGSWVAGNILAASGVNPVSFAVAVIAVAFWQLVGGLIGSIFGGTPRSGADVTWDASSSHFVVSNVWARKGGSQEAARQLATAVGTNLDAVLGALGATLLNPQSVQTGSYGMVKREYVYRPQGGGMDQGQITARFTGANAAQDVITHGTYLALNSMLGRLAGGDIYLKRALSADLSLAAGNPLSNAPGAAGQFDMTTLLGDLTIAQDYSNYLSNRTAVSGLIAADPQSAFSAGWLVTLARANELGLNKRSATDWTGGYTIFLDEIADSKIGGSVLSAAQLSAEIDRDTGARYWTAVDANGDFLGNVEDTIETESITRITATAAAETIDLRSAKLADQRGYTVNGKLNNDIAVAGSDFTALTQTVTFAAGEVRQSVNVTVTKDALAEAAETFLGTLSNGTNLSVVGGSAEATLLDGTAALPTLLVGRSFAREGDGYAVFRVSLSKAATGAVSASLAVLDDTTTVGIDRGAGIEVSDDGVSWTAATALTFTTGQVQKFVRVAVLADNVANPDYVAPTTDPFTGATIPGNGKPQFLNVEGNERFTLSATVTAGASLIANAADANGVVGARGTGTILDATTGTLPLAWIDAVTLDEASGLATFSIARSSGAGTGSLTFATADRKELAIDVAATVDAGDGNDLVYASNLGDNVFGGAGNDTLYGGRLDDWLLGGDGDDLLDAGGPDLGALGGDGNYLNGGAGNDVLRGREGSDWLEGGEGADTLTGGGGDDILAGGAGDGDQLAGGAGNDQYVVRRGDGLDTINDEAVGAPVAATTGGDAISQRFAGIANGTIRADWAGTWGGVVNDNAAGGEDAVVFGAGIEIGDIQLKRSGTAAAPGNDLIIMVMQTVNGVESFSGTQLTIKDWFANPFKRVEWLKFADGTELRLGDLSSFITGTSGNDVLIGTAGNEPTNFTNVTRVRKTKNLASGRRGQRWKRAARSVTEPGRVGKRVTCAWRVAMQS